MSNECIQVSAFTLALRQVRYENTTFWRNPVAAIFTFVFPLMFLVIFNLIFGNTEMALPGGTVTTSTFYVPAITALSVIGACYTNVAMGVCFSRERGVFKRVRGTPLPTWALLFGRLAIAIVVAAILVVIMLGAGALFYGVTLPTNTLPAFLVTLVLGAATFCALGLAVASIVPNADAAPAIVNVSILPLMFISDIFIRMEDSPAWVTIVADIFPVRHFAQAMHTSFNPFETGAGFEPLHLLVMAAWLVVGVVVAVRFFRWEPRR